MSAINGYYADSFSTSQQIHRQPGSLAKETNLDKETQGHNSTSKSMVAKTPTGKKAALHFSPERKGATGPGSDQTGQSGENPANSEGRLPVDLKLEIALARRYLRPCRIVSYDGLTAREKTTKKYKVPDRS
ncbi:MAG: hypothetical protein OEL83_04115 [Desulforhopalus sp.]|nr:hypothetical protein [Desulforhopalus sp.]